MRTSMAVMIVATVMAAGACSRTVASGPNGGDVVPIKNGGAKAEVVSNPTTGEVLVQTYDDRLQSRKPIERQPITIGSGDDTTELEPYPVDTDPPGSSSRFYGHADWIRGGQTREGWMVGGGTGRSRQRFEWQHGWDAGRTQARMWEGLAEHRRMGFEHGSGPREPIGR